jgi:hypothetical protein
MKSSYLKVAGIDGIGTGSTVDWAVDWSGNLPAPNVFPRGNKCLVTNESIAGQPYQTPSSGVLTLTPTVMCGDESVELDPITLVIEIEFVEPTPPCCPSLIRLTINVDFWYYAQFNHIYTAELLDELGEVIDTLTPGEILGGHVTHDGSIQYCYDQSNAVVKFSNSPKPAHSLRLDISQWYYEELDNVGYEFEYYGRAVSGSIPYGRNIIDIALV